MDIIKTTTGNLNTPAIIDTATALAANTARIGWMIQNLGQQILYVRMGASASATVFHVALKAGTANDDGTGGSYEQVSGVVYTGIVTIAGTTPRYCVTEIRP